MPVPLSMPLAEEENMKMSYNKRMRGREKYEKYIEGKKI